MRKELDFQKPNAHTITTIDSFFQNMVAEDSRISKRLTNQWDDLSYRYYPENSDGWDDVEKRHPDLFAKFWYVALGFIHQNGFEFKDIVDYQNNY